MGSTGRREEGRTQGISPSSYLRQHLCPWLVFSVALAPSSRPQVLLDRSGCVSHFCPVAADTGHFSHCLFPKSLQPKNWSVFLLLISGAHLRPSFTCVTSFLYGIPSVQNEWTVSGMLLSSWGYRWNSGAPGASAPQAAQPSWRSGTIYRSAVPCVRGPLCFPTWNSGKCLQLHTAAEWVTLQVQWL